MKQAQEATQCLTGNQGHLKSAPAEPMLGGSMAGTARELGDIVSKTGVIWELDDRNDIDEDDNEESTRALQSNPR